MKIIDCESFGNTLIEKCSLRKRFGIDVQKVDGQLAGFLGKALTGRYKDRYLLYRPWAETRIDIVGTGQRFVFVPNDPKEPVEALIEPDRDEIIERLTLWDRNFNKDLAWYG